MHELACMNPASYFIRERDGRATEILKLAGTCLAVIFSAGILLGTSYFTNGNWSFLFGAKKQIPDLSRMFYRILYYLCLGITYFWRFLRWSFSKRPAGVSQPEGRNGHGSALQDIYDHWMDTVYPGISPRFDPGRWISATGCVFLGALCRWTIIIHES